MPDHEEVPAFGGKVPNKLALRRGVWGECGAPRAALRAVGVEIPEDQRTSNSPDCGDLDDDRAYFVLPCL